MDFSTTPIVQLIPQRPPFLMVDRVVCCSQTAAQTEFDIRPDNIFVDDGELLAAGIIENMAQSCAAIMGCVDLLRGEPVKIGFIGNVRDAVIRRQPHPGERLTTHIEIIEDIFNLLLAEVRVEAGSELIATALMKVAKTDIVANMAAGG